MSDTDRLAQIKSRLRAITPGPWRVWPINRCYLCSIVAADDRVLGETCSPDAKENAAFIGAAPDDVAWLVGEIERLQQERVAIVARWELYALLLRAGGRNIAQPAPREVSIWRWAVDRREHETTAGRLLDLAEKAGGWFRDLHKDEPHFVPLESWRREIESQEASDNGR